VSRRLCVADSGKEINNSENVLIGRVSLCGEVGQLTALSMSSVVCHCHARKSPATSVGCRS